jgi:hypothetical protein
VIQEGLQEGWPRGITAAVDPFQQGHLIENPPIFYATDLRGPIWGPGRTIAEEASSEALGVEVVELDPEDGPPYGVITSQTCEIAEDRPEPLHPWIQVAPVYRCDPGSKLLERDFVVRLDPPGLAGEVWVADLRLETPLEKSLLLGRKPIEAFGDQGGYEDFGNELGGRRGRPALGGAIYEVFTATMLAVRNVNKTSKKTVKRFRDDIYKMKLGIEQGSRLEPQAARLYVVTRKEPGEEMKKFFADWWDRASEIASARGLDLQQTTWLSETNLEIPLAAYEKLIDLRSPL